MATVSTVSGHLLSNATMPLAGEAIGLVPRAKAGEGSAFRSLFETHAARIYSLCLRLMGQETRAENLTREIFLATFSNLNAIADDNAFAVELRRRAAQSILAKHVEHPLNECARQHLTPNQHLSQAGQSEAGPDQPTHTESRPRSHMTSPRPVIVKQLPAQLKLGQIQEFLREVDPLITADRPCIVFDFSHVTQIDSAGVDMLLHCMEQAMKRNGDLKLAAVPPASAVILELTRVDRLFEVFETVSEAVDSFYGFSVPAQHA